MIGRYDSSLQMFIDPPKSLDYKKLAFMRALAEHNCLEQLPYGEPSGAILDNGTTTISSPLTDDEKVQILMAARLGVAVYSIGDIALTAMMNEN